MRVILDGTPLLGPHTGVGRYTASLLAQLPTLPGLDVSATAFTWRGLDDLAQALPAGVRPAGRRVPARLVHEAWARSELPRLEWLTGAVDVVHATNFVLPPTRRARGVLTIHDLAYLKLSDTVSTASARYRELVPRGLRRAAAVIAPSQAIATEIVDTYRLDPALVTVTALGVDEAWFDASPPPPRWLEAHGLPSRYLLFVGTREPRKNLPTLLDAVRGLHAEMSDAPPLVLTGPKGWGPALDLSGLPPGAVVTTGYLPVDLLRRLVAGASALCFPSFYEGFGLPPLEALAAGTPVVASDIPAVREVLGPVAGQTARLVPPTDADAFTDALIGVLKSDIDPTPGRDHARSFTWRRTAERTAAVYRSVGQPA